MRKLTFQWFLICSIIFIGLGCSSKGVKVRHYLQDKQRVDQEVQGTLGNWENSPDAVYTAEKDTRKIYVVEVTQEADTVVEKQMMIDESYQAPVSNTYDQRVDETRREATKEPELNLPSFNDEFVFEDDDVAVEVEDKNETEYVDYKVEKDDTLQKISKKFYDSYSKWPKIYEANKSQIKNPDRIKPGIVIKIPMEN